MVEMWGIDSANWIFSSRIQLPPQRHATVYMLSVNSNYHFSLTLTFIQWVTLQKLSLYFTSYSNFVSLSRFRAHVIFLQTATIVIPLSCPRYIAASLHSDLNILTSISSANYHSVFYSETDLQSLILIFLKLFSPLYLGRNF